jgi:hypothetical protein
MPLPAHLDVLIDDLNISECGISSAAAAELLRRIGSGSDFDSVAEIARRSGNSAAARERRVRDALTAAADRLNS